jgi:hypothetical protein
LVDEAGGKKLKSYEENLKKIDLGAFFPEKELPKEFSSQNAPFHNFSMKNRLLQAVARSTQLGKWYGKEGLKMSTFQSRGAISAKISPKENFPSQKSK